MQDYMSKQEIKDWINFLYSDLLNDNVNIGGYYFNFSQLKDFEKLKEELDKKSRKILNKNSEGSQLSTSSRNSSYSARQCAQNENFDKLNKLSVKLTTKNRFNEKLQFPVTQNEFFYIYNELEKAKDDVEHFKKYLLEELNNENIKEECSEFMCFINDYLEDIRHKFQGDTNFG